MNLLKRIDYMRQAPQFQKSFDVIMWLNKYRKLTGHNIDKKYIFDKCNINYGIFNKILAGNPWIKLEVYSNIINQIHNLCNDITHQYINYSKNYTHYTYKTIFTYGTHEDKYMNGDNYIGSNIKMARAWA